jgi:hypothetical protein
MNRLWDRQVATVLQIAVQNGSSGHLCKNRRYCLFSGHSISLCQAHPTFSRGILEGARARLQFVIFRLEMDGNIEKTD